MQTRSATPESHSSASRPFFSGQPSHALLRQSEPAQDFFSPSPFVLAAKEQPGEVEEQETEQQASVIQTKLTMGAPGDRFEREADAVADRVVQRMYAGSVSGERAPTVQTKCEACREEEKLQRKPEQDETGEMLQGKADAPADVSDSVHQTLEGGRGGGQPMQSPLREEMESAFDRDLSDVRIHTGNSAENLNQDLSARAFTYGTDVYFNSGEFRPETQQGRHLLAHELTHVVQQNAGLQRTAQPDAHGGAGSVSSTSGRKVQRQTWSFGPAPGLPSGTKIHNLVLPLFAEKNPDIFIEAKVPGATRVDIETGKWGVADFYRAGPTGDAKGQRSRTIGINFTPAGPEFLDRDGKLRGGGKGYSHQKYSAPQGDVLIKPRVRDLALGPGDIEVGDLKPPSAAEAILGGGQLSNYRTGIVNTANSIRKWLAEPRNRDQSKGGNWDPKPRNMESLSIPDVLDYPTGRGLVRNRLAAYLDGIKVVPDAGFVGSMYVYKHSQSGIWVYEWIPEGPIPSATGSGEVNNVIRRLNDEVIAPIRETGAEKGQGKRFARDAAAVRRKTKKVIRRKEKGFPYLAWKGKYSTWKLDTEKFLGNPRERQKGEVAATLVDVDKRAHHRLNLPAEVKERGVGFGKIRHWMRFGGIYGWLRNTFDGAYVKIKNLTDRIKKKVQAFAKKVGSTSFGSWVKAVAKVIFKIFKIVASWAVTQVIDRLIASFQEGITNNLRKLMDAITPEGVTSKIEEFEEKKAEYEALIKEKEEELEKRLFGDKLGLIEKVEEWEKIAETASTIATLVEWGVRLLACASPPAIGCLWNLLISALQAAFAMLIQTCWFTQKVYQPVLNAIQPVRDFPTMIAAFVVDKANAIIPLPSEMDPIFAPITLDQSKISVECGGGGGGGDGAGSLTAERRAILDLVEKIGKEKFEALLDLMRKRGAGPWVLLTAERLAELQTALDSVPVEQLKKAAEQPDSKVPTSLESFVGDIKKYNPQEKKLIADAAKRKAAEAAAKKAREAAAAGKTVAGGGGGGDTAVKPIKDAPGPITGSSATAYSVITLLPEPLKPGGSYSKVIDVYMIVGVKDSDNNKGVVSVYPVTLRVQSVSDKEAVFINQNTFYVYYFENHFIQILKDAPIKVQASLLSNAPP